MHTLKTREELEAAAQNCLYDPQLTYVYKVARSAAARAFLGLHRDTHTPDFEDAVQEAAITFYHAYGQKGSAAYAYAAARNQAFQSMVRRPSVPFPLSLDTNPPGDQGGETWDELIAAPPTDMVPERSGVDEWTDADWISDADLGSTIEKAYIADGCQLRPSKTRMKVQIVHLLMKGYDRAAIATELGLKEQVVTKTRTDIRRCLAAYCRHIGIDVPDFTVQQGGWYPARYYGRYPKRRSPTPRRGGFPARPS